MSEYLSPGVYVEEYDNSPRAVEGGGTVTAGFVGMAEKGPVGGNPVFITGISDFERTFGGYLSEHVYGEYRYLAPSVEAFFKNGGTKAYIARVAPKDAKEASIKLGNLSVKAASCGSYGNRIVLDFSYEMKRKMQLLKEIDSMTFEAKSTEGFREGDLVKIGGEYNTISKIHEKTVTFSREFSASPVDAKLVPDTLLYLVELGLQISDGKTNEVYSELSVNLQSPGFIDLVLQSSNLVKLSFSPLTEPSDPLVAIFGDEAERFHIELAGGTDGNLKSVSPMIFVGEDGGPGKRTGIHSLAECTDISMVAVPGVTMPDVIVSLVAHCENLKDRFAVLDMPKTMSNPKELVGYRGMIDSTYAAMYHPWIQSTDRLTQRPEFYPPSGAVCGIYARSDLTRGVHKAPANETVACTGLSVNFSFAEQDLLNPEGINLIRNIPGMGIRVWGARTASSNSTFRYVNVRRLFIFVEESIKRNTGWVVFEPNDTTLWTRVHITISSFLEGLWRQGMLAGETAEEAFFVEIGTSTMTNDDIANGKLICNVGFAPSRPAEFVIFRVTQFTRESGE